ncbi:MAG: outer membrane lipoprotein-sorting protein [Myxococcota bacterium]
MRVRDWSLLCCLLPAGAAFADEAELKGAAIAASVLHRSVGFGDQAVKIHMELRNAQGDVASRELRVRSLEDEGSVYSLIIFDTPRDVKGTALLVHGEDQWLYLPAAGQERRISSSNRSGPFAGSEFAYEDLIAARPSEYTWKHLGAEACGDGTCDLVESRPKDDRSGYTKRILSVEQGSGRLKKVDFYDKKDSLLKTLAYSEHKTYQGKLDRALVWTMTNHQSGKSTVLRFDEFQFKNGYTVSDFSVAKLKMVR